MSGRLKTLKILIGLLSFVCSCAGAELKGRVLDNVGAVLPNATIQVRNLNKSIKLSQHADKTGQFIFHLPSGKYELRITSTCFKAFKEQVSLDDNAHADKEITLKLAEKH